MKCESSSTNLQTIIKLTADIWNVEDQVLEFDVYGWPMWQVFKRSQRFLALSPRGWLLFHTYFVGGILHCSSVTWNTRRKSLKLSNFWNNSRKLHFPSKSLGSSYESITHLTVDYETPLWNENEMKFLEWNVTCVHCPFIALIFSQQRQSRVLIIGTRSLSWHFKFRWMHTLLLGEWLISEVKGVTLDLENDAIILATVTCNWISNEGIRIINRVVTMSNRSVTLIASNEWAYFPNGNPLYFPVIVSWTIENVVTDAVGFHYCVSVLINDGKRTIVLQLCFCLSVENWHETEERKIEMHYCHNYRRSITGQMLQLVSWTIDAVAFSGSAQSQLENRRNDVHIVDVFVQLAIECFRNYYDCVRLRDSIKRIELGKFFVKRIITWFVNDARRFERLNSG